MPAVAPLQIEFVRVGDWAVSPPAAHPAPAVISKSPPPAVANLMLGEKSNPEFRDRSPETTDAARFEESISRTEIRTLPPSLRTLPSTTLSMAKLGADCQNQVSLSCQRGEDVRAITLKPGILANASISSSVNPPAKYSLSLSPAEIGKGCDHQSRVSRTLCRSGNMSRREDPCPGRNRHDNLPPQPPRFDGAMDLGPAVTGATGASSIN